jgi:hypothetical protein
LIPISKAFFFESRRDREARAGVSVADVEGESMLDRWKQWDEIYTHPDSCLKLFRFVKDA